MTLKEQYYNNPEDDVFAFDNIFDFSGKQKLFLFYYFFVPDDVDGDIGIQKAQNVKIQKINGTFHLQDILFAHFAASCIFDDGDTAVQAVQLKIFIDFHTFSGLDVVQYKAFTDCTYI